MAPRYALGGDRVARHVGATGVDGLRIDVHRLYPASPQQNGGDGQDSGAAAVIDEVPVVEGLLGKPAQAQGRGRVTAGAEGQPRVQPQVDCPGIGRVDPARNDPQSILPSQRLALLAIRLFPVALLQAVAFQRR